MQTTIATAAELEIVYRLEMTTALRIRINVH